MNYQTILSQPLVALRDMSLEQFTKLFNSVNEEIEKLEAARNTRRYYDIDTGKFTLMTGADQLKRLEKLSTLRIAKQNLTMHRHYAAYCEAHDNKHWDSVYHRPLPAL